MSKGEHVEVSLNGAEPLTLEQFIQVSRYGAPVAPFRGKKREQVERVRAYVEKRWLSDDSETKYGFNTGIGALKNVRISQEKIKQFQARYVKSHSVGLGEPLAVEIVRGAMLLQARALSRGYSGVRALLVDKLIEMLNKGVHPVVPEQGSLGASGDLAPLTHIASVLVGEPEAEIWVGPHRRRLSDLLDATGAVRFEQNGKEVRFETIELHGKEAVSLTNATSVMLSIACHLLHDVESLLLHADVAAALSLEAMMCEPDAFDERLHRVRNQAGQILTAQNMRALIAGSRRMTPEAREAYFRARTEEAVRRAWPHDEDVRARETVERYKLEVEFEPNRVQDAYSLRCVPQVHGACRDAVRYFREVVLRELHAVTDNPLIFPTAEGKAYEALSGGNFHGEPLALAADFLGIALTELGSIAERRVFRLLSPSLSFGLPRNLTGGEPGLNSGLMLTQYTAAQLVSENKVLAHPASVDSIPTSENQEDHVSMGLIAARKARRILHNVQNLVAIETLCATQGIHLSARYASTNLTRFPLGKGTAAAFAYLENYEAEDGVRPFALMTDDQYLHRRMTRMRDLVAQGKIGEVVAAAVKVQAL